MNKLKIFLITTLFCLSSIAFCFADTSTDTSIDYSSKYKYYFLCDFGGIYFNTLNSVSHNSNGVIVSVKDGYATTWNGKLISESTSIVYTIKYESGPVTTNNTVLKKYISENGSAYGNGDVTIPPWMKVEELPKMVGSTILLVASVGISILCLMQLPTLVKKLLLFLR